jgi:hypothetical protein
VLWDEGVHVDQDELMELIRGCPVPDDEVAIFPAGRVEIDDVDSERLVLTVHFFPNEDAYVASKPLYMKFVLTQSGASGLSAMLDSAVTTMRHGHKGS